MSLSVFLIVLAAAFMHAAWNAVVKSAGDRTLTIGLVNIGHIVPGIAIACFVPLPDLAAVPFIIASTIIHWAYYYCLNMAYRVGDLSLIYPIARGVTPVMVAFPAYFLLGEELSPEGWAGIFCISAGILLLGIFSSRGSKSNGGSSFVAIAFALATGMMIATYSLTDGVGVRISENPLSYIAWLFIAEGLAVIYIFVPRMERLRALSRRELWIGFGGGVLSSAAYGLVMYAKTLAPIAMVSALRETSVIFAALIGLIWFAERPVHPRLIAALCVCGGVVLLAVA